MGRLMTRLQVGACGTGKVYPDSNLFGALAVCDEHRIEVLEVVNIFQWLTIKQSSLAQVTKDEC